MTPVRILDFLQPSARLVIIYAQRNATIKKKGATPAISPVVVIPVK